MADQPGHVYHYRHGWIPVNPQASSSMAGAISAHVNTREERRTGRAPDLRAASDEELAARLGNASDDAEVDSIVAELDRRDAAARTAARTAARRDARRAVQEAEYERRVDAGGDPEEVYAAVYGVPVEKQRRQNAIAALRAAGYTGGDYADLTRAAYRDYIDQQMADAEQQTRGVFFRGLTNPREQRDPRLLFTGNENYARRNASDELLDYWQAHGRLTVGDFRASILGGRLHVKETAAWH